MSRRTTLQAASATDTTAQAVEAEGTPGLVTYPVPDGAPTNASYTVKVRTPGGSWQQLGTYLATLNLISTATGAGQIQNSSSRSSTSRTPSRSRSPT